MTFMFNILTLELMRCFTDLTETLLSISINTFLVPFLTGSILMQVVQFFVCSSTKSFKVIFLLVSFHLFILSMVRINVL